MCANMTAVRTFPNYLCDVRTTATSKCAASQIMILSILYVPCSRQQKTAQTLERCEQQLCLGCLRTSSILTEAQIIHGCCSLLSLSSPSSRSGVSDDASGLLSGLRVCLGTHYAVSADGEVRLPWNFVTGVSKSASNCDSHTV